MNSIALLVQAESKKGSKLTQTEVLLLELLSQQQASSGEELYLLLYNKGIRISYPTVYVTLRRLVRIGLLDKQTCPGERKVRYGLLNDKN